MWGTGSKKRTGAKESKRKTGSGGSGGGSARGTAGAGTAAMASTAGSGGGGGGGTTAVVASDKRLVSCVASFLSDLLIPLHESHSDLPLAGRIDAYHSLSSALHSLELTSTTKFAAAPAVAAAVAATAASKLEWRGWSLLRLCFEFVIAIDQFAEHGASALAGLQSDAKSGESDSPALAAAAAATNPNPKPAHGRGVSVSAISVASVAAVDSVQLTSQIQARCDELLSAIRTLRSGADAQRIALSAVQTLQQTVGQLKITKISARHAIAIAIRREDATALELAITTAVACGLPGQEVAAARGVLFPLKAKADARRALQAAYDVKLETSLESLDGSGSGSGTHTHSAVSHAAGSAAAADALHSAIKNAHVWHVPVSSSHVERARQFRIQSLRQSLSEAINEEDATALSTAILTSNTFVESGGGIVNGDGIRSPSPNPDAAATTTVLMSSLADEIESAKAVLKAFRKNRIAQRSGLAYKPSPAVATVSGAAAAAAAAASRASSAGRTRRSSAAGSEILDAVAMMPAFEPTPAPAPTAAPARKPIVFSTRANSSVVAGAGSTAASASAATHTSVGGSVSARSPPTQARTQKPAAVPGTSTGAGAAATARGAAAAPATHAFPPPLAPKLMTATGGGQPKGGAVPLSKIAAAAAAKQQHARRQSSSTQMAANLTAAVANLLAQSPKSGAQAAAALVRGAANFSRSTAAAATTNGGAAATASTATATTASTAATATATATATPTKSANSKPASKTSEMIRRDKRNSKRLSAAASGAVTLIPSGVEGTPPSTARIPPPAGSGGVAMPEPRLIVKHPRTGKRIAVPITGTAAPTATATTSTTATAAATATASVSSTETGSDNTTETGAVPPLDTTKSFKDERRAHLAAVTVQPVYREPDLNVKLHLVGDSRVYRLALSPKISLIDFTSRVRAKYDMTEASHPAATTRLQWRDRDGDHIAISTEEDLDIAKRSAPGKARIIDLYITSTAHANHANTNTNTTATATTTTGGTAASNTTATAPAVTAAAAAPAQSQSQSQPPTTRALSLNQRKATANAAGPPLPRASSITAARRGDTNSTSNGSMSSRFRSPSPRGALVPPLSFPLKAAAGADAATAAAAANETLSPTTVSGSLSPVMRGPMPRSSSNSPVSPRLSGSPRASLSTGFDAVPASGRRSAQALLSTRYRDHKSSAAPNSKFISESDPAAAAAEDTDDDHSDDDETRPARILAAMTNRPSVLGGTMISATASYRDRSERDRNADKNSSPQQRPRSVQSPRKSVNAGAVASGSALPPTATLSNNSRPSINSGAAAAAAAPAGLRLPLVMPTNGSTASGPYSPRAAANAAAAAAAAAASTSASTAVVPDQRLLQRLKKHAKDMDSARNRPT